MTGAGFSRRRWIEAVLRRPMFRQKILFALTSPSSALQRRIWFDFVERVTGNHIDEWLLTCEHQEGKQ